MFLSFIFQLVANRVSTSESPEILEYDSDFDYKRSKKKAKKEKKEKSRKKKHKKSEKLGIHSFVLS